MSFDIIDKVTLTNLRGDRKRLLIKIVLTLLFFYIVFDGWKMFLSQEFFTQAKWLNMLNILTYLLFVIVYWFWRDKF